MRLPDTLKLLSFLYQNEYCPIAGNPVYEMLIILVLVLHVYITVVLFAPWGNPF